MPVSLRDLEPALSGLAGAQQNPAYHGEGDALAHTRLVVEALRDLPPFLALDEAGKQLMLTAAALHDLGKKACTRLEDGQWTSPRHSVVGAGMARELLMTRFDLGGDPEALREREAICALVRWHMRPAHILEGEHPGRAVRQMAALGELAPDFTLERLAMLAEADNRGRICDDREARLEAVALFAELAREEGCYREPFVYPDGYSRYADFSGRNVQPGQRLYDDTWGTVAMLSGLPGTGKDAYCARHCADLPMLSLDELRREMGVSPRDDQGGVIQQARERAREFLRQRQPFVFNATNLSVMLRRKWIALFHQYGAAVRIVYLETPWAERERRNASRQHRVPEAAVRDMLRHLEPPTLAEAEEVVWLCV